MNLQTTLLSTQASTSSTRKGKVLIKNQDNFYIYMKHTTSDFSQQSSNSLSDDVVHNFDEYYWDNEFEQLYDANTFLNREVDELKTKISNMSYTIYGLEDYNKMLKQVIDEKERLIQVLLSMIDEKRN